MRKLWWMAVALVGLTVGLDARGHAGTDAEDDAVPDRHRAPGLAVELDGAGLDPRLSSRRRSTPTSTSSRSTPNYTFSWEGVIHYMWFKEYHPDEWARVQKYVADGRWRLAGSWIERRRSQHAVAGVAVPAGAVRAALLPAGVQRQGVARRLSAGQFRLRLRAAVDRRALRPELVLDAEAHLGPADSVPDRPLEGCGRQRDHRGAESGQLRDADSRGHHAHVDQRRPRGRRALAERSDDRSTAGASSSATSARATPAARRAKPRCSSCRRR